MPNKNLKLFQAVLKCLFLMLARNKLIKSMEFLANVYEQNQNYLRAWPVFDAFIHTLIKWLKVFLGFYIFAFAIAIYAPFIYSMVAYLVCVDVRPFSYPLMLPGTSLDIDDHYELNILAQWILGHLNGFIYMLWDALFVLQFLHAILMTNLVCDRIRATEQLLIAKTLSPPSDISSNLKRAIVLQIEFDGFVQMIQDLYYYPLMIIFAVALQSIGSKMLFMLNMGVGVRIRLFLEICSQ